MITKPEYKPLPVTALEADPRNANVCPAETLAKLQANMERSGICPALVVRPHPKKKGRYVVIDGHHRHRVAGELGWEEVPCEVWQVDDADAQLLLATLNRLRGEDNPRKRAELLDSLSAHLGPDELLRLIPESKSELEDLLALLDLETAELEEKLRKAIEKDETELPVVLNFVLAKADAERVQAILTRFQPTGNDNPSSGLIALCESVADKAEKGHVKA